MLGGGLYIGLASCNGETFISVLFGNFDLIGDILDAKNINWTSIVTWHIFTTFKDSFVMV